MAKVGPMLAVKSISCPNRLSSQFLNRDAGRSQHASWMKSDSVLAPSPHPLPRPLLKTSLNNLRHLVDLVLLEKPAVQGLYCCQAGSVRRGHFDQWRVAAQLVLEQAEHDQDGQRVQKAVAYKVC